MASEEEFPPLLQPGLQKMTLAQLKVLVVDKFPRSKKRKELWQNFEQLLEELSTLGLKCEIWVNGSFLTEKLDPSDVDFVVDVPIDLLPSLTEQQQALVRTLSSNFGTSRVSGYI